MEIAGRARPPLLVEPRTHHGFRSATTTATCSSSSGRSTSSARSRPCFSCHPQDLGVTFDVNRSTSEVQQEQTEDRGVRPLLRLVQEHLTREIVWDGAFGGPDNNLAFRFTRLNLRETLNAAKVIDLQLSGVPYRSPNEIRREQGLEPWGSEFDEPMMVTPTGAVRLSDVPTAREVLEAKSTPARSAADTPPANEAQAASVGSRASSNT